MAQKVPQQVVAILLFVSVVLAGCLSGVSAVADERDRSRPANATATPATATDCLATTSPNAHLITVPPTAANLDETNATDLAARYERTYRNAQSDLDERGSVGTAVQETNVTRLGDGYLVQLDVVFGGQFVITAEPERPTSVIEDGEVELQTTRPPETTVVHVDDFYTAYYYISATRVVRHETYRNGEPPETPQHGGELLVCRSDAS